MSLIFATQLTAAATVALAVLAFATAIFAGLAYCKQSKEVGILLEQHKREVHDRRRAQASRVFVLANPSLQEDEPISSIEVSVKNTSQQPIYDLILLWRDETGEWIELGDPVYLRVLLPDEQHNWGTGIEPSIPIQSFLRDPSVIGSAILFRDAAGVRWRLDSYAQLDEGPVTE